jgi:TRAP-type C4-dicarboxylate transport system permease small subunit
MGILVTREKVKSMVSFAGMVYAASRKLNAVSAWILVCLMGLVTVNVISRHFGHPIFGVYDFVGFLLALYISFSIGECAVRKGHITVNIVADLLPKAVLPFLDAVVAVLGTTLYSVLSWQCYVYGRRVWSSGEMSMGLQIPFYPFIFGVAFGLFMLSLVLMVDIVEAIKRIAHK